MHHSAIAACVVLGLFGACTAQPVEHVELDGPVAYYGSSVLGSRRELHVMVDGSASLRLVAEAGTPRDFPGMTSAAALATLHDDIAAADLRSLSPTYSCPVPVCDGPRFFRTLVVEVGGDTAQISVGAGVSNTQLPARLGKVLQDLDALSAQLTPTAAP